MAQALAAYAAICEPAVVADFFRMVVTKLIKVVWFESVIGHWTCDIIVLIGCVRRACASNRDQLLCRCRGFLFRVVWI